jgi:hypothetical protein
MFIINIYIMLGYLWILFSFFLLIGWIYTRDTIRTDRKSGNMDFHTYIAAIIGISLIFIFINKLFMKKI